MRIVTVKAVLWVFLPVLLCCLHCWCFCIADFSSTWSGICEAKRKPNKLTNTLFFRLTSLASLSFSHHFSEPTVCLFYVYYLRFLAEFSRNGQVCLSHFGLDIVLKIKNMIFIYCPTPKSQTSSLSWGHFQKSRLIIRSVISF